MGRGKYLKDYDVSEGADGKKIVTYTGRLYNVAMGREEYGRLRVWLTASVIGAVAAYICSGVIPAPASRSAWVTIPFAVGFLLTWFAVTDVFSVFMGKMAFTEREYVKIAQNAPKLFVTLSVLAGVCCAGTAAFCLINAGSAADWAFAATCAAWGGVCIITKRVLERITEKIE